jgi:hypothetical protein
MVALAAGVEGEHLSRGGLEDQPAEGILTEEKRREADAFGPQLHAQLGERGRVEHERNAEAEGLADGDDEVFAVGFEGVDLVEHGADAVHRPGGEMDDDGFCLVAQQPPQRLPHATP